MRSVKILFGLSIIAATTFTSADTDVTSIGDTEMPEAVHSKAFIQMRSMLGKWQGKLTQSSGNVVDTSSEFRLVSNGNTITEKLIEDGVEMLTTYTDQDGELVVKHYCALGTEPVFKVSNLTSKTLKIELDAAESNYHPGHHSFVNSMQWTPDPTDASMVVVDATIFLDGELQAQQTVLQRAN